MKFIKNNHLFWSYTYITIQKRIWGIKAKETFSKFVLDRRKVDDLKTLFGFDELE